MTVTTDRAAFLNTILTDPTDDTPRLVFADYLEEHPDGPADVARAQFIRHQIAEAFHNRNVYYVAFEAMCKEWEGKYGVSTPKDPIRPDQCPATGEEYLRSYRKSKLMETQGRLMMERWAGEWLADLAEKVLPPSYYVWRNTKTKNRIRPDIVVRRNETGADGENWRDWIEFEAFDTSLLERKRLNTGPLFHFRRGFINQLSYHYFYHNFGKDQLAEMFRRHPIESVRGTRNPTTSNWIAWSDEEPHWLWEHQANPEALTPQHVIPSRIYVRLPNCAALKGRYPTEASAIADFQWACVALGRELAGLPMLEKPPVPSLNAAEVPHE